MSSSKSDRWAIVPVILSVLFLVFVILFAVGPNLGDAVILLIGSFIFIGGLAITQGRIGVHGFGGCDHNYEHKAGINVPQCSRCGQFAD